MSTATEPERDALAALEQGDQKAALTIVMKAYGDALYRYCRMIVTDPALAEDAHQLTFVQAYQSLASFSGRSTLRAWLYGIARHRCLDALKGRRRRRKRIEPRAELPDAADPSASAQERIERQELVGGLEACLRELDPKVRIAVVLRYQEDFSYKEMSAICGERPATLQARVARALPVLRRCLEARGRQP